MISDQLLLFFCNISCIRKNFGGQYGHYNCNALSHVSQLSDYGALFAGLAVAIGTFGAHALKGKFAKRDYEQTFETGVTYWFTNGASWGIRIISNRYVVHDWWYCVIFWKLICPFVNRYS